MGVDSFLVAPFTTMNHNILVSGFHNLRCHIGYDKYESLRCAQNDTLVLCFNPISISERICLVNV